MKKIKFRKSSLKKKKRNEITLDHKVIRKVAKFKHNVKIYSTSTCPWCVKAKKLLKKLRVHFQEIDVSRNELAKREMMLKSHQLGVPVIDIDGNIIVGYDEKTIKKLLK